MDCYKEADDKFQLEKVDERFEESNDNTGFFLKEYQQIIYFFKNNEIKNYKKELKNIINFFDDLFKKEIHVNYSEILINQKIEGQNLIDFCLDRYSRCKQDSKIALLCLNILKFFSLSDDQYVRYIAKDFVFYSQENLQEQFPFFFELEMEILNSIISIPDLSFLFRGYNFLHFVEKVKQDQKILDLCSIYIFLNKFIECGIAQKPEIDIILELFIDLKAIKGPDILNQDARCFHVWCDIMVNLSNSEFFDFSAFERTSLFMFYQKFYLSPEYFLQLSVFYSNLLLHHPEYKKFFPPLLPQCIQHLKSSNEDIKWTAYNLIGNHIFIYLKSQNDPIEVKLASYVNDQLDKNYVDILNAIESDIGKSPFFVTTNAFFLLAVLVIFRSDLVFQKITPVEYVEQFADYLDEFSKAFFFSDFLSSFECVFQYVQKLPDYKSICDKIFNSDTFNVLKEFVSTPDRCQKKHVEQISHILKLFST